jgi:hypothetical protein
MARLLESIRLRGILSPLITTQEMYLIDGHRRLACAKVLGLRTVPVVRVNGSDADEAFVEINLCPRQVNGVEWLHIYLSGGKVHKEMLGNIKRIEAVCGADFLIQMRDMSISPSIWDAVARVTRFCDFDPHDQATMKRIVEWIVLGRRQYQFWQAMGRGITPTVLAKAVMSDKDIVASYRVVQ